MERRQERRTCIEQILDPITFRGTPMPLDHVEHHIDRADRMLADGGFGGENEPIRAVEKRVDDVVEFGPRRLAVGDHRFEQIRRHVDRLFVQVRFTDDRLLQERDVLQRHFARKVAAIDEDFIGRCQDLVEIQHPALALDLRDDCRLGTNQLA